MYQTSETTEEHKFVDTIKEIKNAEQEYDNLIGAAKEKADKTLRNAKEVIQEENRKESEKIVEKKDELLRKGSKDIEDNVKDITGKAKNDAAKIREKKLPPAAVAELVKRFVSEL